MIYGLIFNLSLHLETEPCTHGMPRKARSGGVELNVGMIEKRKKPRKNISDVEII